ncbi:hypothetical protein P167DRAFT_162752 [Morchella conica CCBAS932]|uniref:Uncharacterized protein n=1 Tax=Morchella conica CCBAS932 TaxID=1392247 RepID=A0A3N4KAP2_9PEZI|nr:hypothetical protein P167DRAFT_162752 [Morchella conica CCBAS932]
MIQYIQHPTGQAQSAVPPASRHLQTAQARPTAPITHREPPTNYTPPHFITASPTPSPTHTPHPVLTPARRPLHHLSLPTVTATPHTHPHTEPSTRRPPQPSNHDTPLRNGPYLFPRPNQQLAQSRPNEGCGITYILRISSLRDRIHQQRQVPSGDPGRLLADVRRCCGWRGCGMLRSTRAVCVDTCGARGV